MSDEQIRELLREMREDPVPPDSLARVRGRVAERVAAKGSRRWMPWANAAMGAVAAGILAYFMLSAPEMPVKPPVPTVERGGYVARVAPAPEPKVVVPVKRKRPARRVETEQQLVIRIETPDPEVVILLIGDGD